MDGWSTVLTRASTVGRSRTVADVDDGVCSELRDMYFLLMCPRHGGAAGDALSGGDEDARRREQSAGEGALAVGARGKLGNVLGAFGELNGDGGRTERLLETLGGSPPSLVGIQAQVLARKHPQRFDEFSAHVRTEQR